MILLYAEIEKTGAWPTHTLINVIVLMGKPNGGVRPIALMPMLYRLWTKCRKPEIQKWEELHRGPWDAAVKGSSALRSAIFTMFQDELAHYDGEEVLRILWDMAKFYDNIDISKLMDRAIEMEYPIMILALGVSMHMAPRVLKTQEHFTMCELPSNGIIAGCTQSNIFARIFLFAILKWSIEGVPINCRMRNPDWDFLKSFVDDITQANKAKKGNKRC